MNAHQSDCGVVAVLWCQFLFEKAPIVIRTNKAFVIFNNVRQWRCNTSAQTHAAVCVCVLPSPAAGTQPSPSCLMQPISYPTQ